jgi:hypothetical protein
MVMILENKELILDKICDKPFGNVLMVEEDKQPEFCNLIQLAT